MGIAQPTKDLARYTVTVEGRISRPDKDGSLTSPTLNPQPPRANMQMKRLTFFIRNRLLQILSKHNNEIFSSSANSLAECDRNSRWEPTCG